MFSIFMSFLSLCVYLKSSSTGHYGCCSDGNIGNDDDAAADVLEIYSVSFAISLVIPS